LADSGGVAPSPACQAPSHTPPGTNTLFPPPSSSLPALHSLPTPPRPAVRPGCWRRRCRRRACRTACPRARPSGRGSRWGGRGRAGAVGAVGAQETGRRVQAPEPGRAHRGPPPHGAWGARVCRAPPTSPSSLPRTPRAIDRRLRRSAASPRPRPVRPQVRDVVAFLRLAAHPLDASGAAVAAALTRPGRSIAPGSPLLSRLRRPPASLLRQHGGVGRLLFGDMVAQQVRGGAGLCVWGGGRRGGACR
jgi:hypothetical protein